MFNRKSKRGFALLETFLVIAFGMIVAALAVLSIVAYRRDAELNNQISDLHELVDGVSAVSKTSSSFLPQLSTDTNIFNILGDTNALPYSLQTQYVKNKTVYLSRLGGQISASVGGLANKELAVTIGGVPKNDCSRVADSLLIPGIKSLTINGVNQPLGPAGNLSSRDPTAGTYALACSSSMSTLVFTYLKPILNIHTNIIDQDIISTTTIVAGPGGTKTTGVGIVANGSSGILMQETSTPALDAGYYEARIYANNVKSSVDIYLDAITGGATTRIFFTTDKNSPRGALVGTTQYIQDIGIIPDPANTNLNTQTFVMKFPLNRSADSINLVVKAADGKTFTITHWTIYPVNPIQ